MKYTLEAYSEDERENITNYLEAIFGDTKQVTILSKEEIKRPLYHVSSNANIKEFIPVVSQRTMRGEDRSLPRISTSTSLIGCLNGYQSLIADVTKSQYKRSPKEKGWDGKYRIYRLPYRYALKPSIKLVPDQKFSDEYWLISWRKETLITKPITVADFIVTSLHENYSNKGNTRDIVLFMHVKEDGFYISKDYQLKTGYYRVVFEAITVKYPIEKNKKISVSSIDEKTYNAMFAFNIK